VKIEDFYKQNNNLFCSLNWLAFQENYGREVIHFSNCAGIKLDMPFGRWGVWVQKGPQKLSKELIKEFKNSGADFVRVEPAQLSKEEINEYNLAYLNHWSLLCGQKSPKATQILNISESEEDILAKMKSKTRYNIRLSQKKGVTVLINDDEDILYELLSQTAKRQKDYSPHPKEYYTKLIKDLSKNDVAHIFVAYNDKLEPIAAILVSFYGSVATYLHGGFSEKSKNLMAPYLCHYEAIKYAKQHGCEYYDFWGVAETDDRNDPWVGITRFKQGFGGKKIVFPGTYDYINSKFWYNTLTLISRIRKVL